MPETQKRPLKVFLCYTRKDSNDVLKLYKQLEKDGVDAWLDTEKILPGQNWKEEIEKAVQKSDTIVVCLSKKSITKEGHVQSEIKMALDIAKEKPEDTIYIIPARIEEVEVPFTLSPIQWVDLFKDDGYKRLTQSLSHRAKQVGARDICFEEKERKRPWTLIISTILGTILFLVLSTLSATARVTLNKKTAIYPVASYTVPTTYVATHSNVTYDLCLYDISSDVFQVSYPSLGCTGDISAGWIDAQNVENRFLKILQTIPNIQK